MGYWKQVNVVWYHAYSNELMPLFCVPLLLLVFDSLFFKNYIFVITKGLNKRSNLKLCYSVHCEKNMDHKRWWEKKSHRWDHIKTFFRHWINIFLSPNLRLVSLTESIWPKFGQRLFLPNLNLTIYFLFFQRIQIFNIHI